MVRLLKLLSVPAFILGLGLSNVAIAAPTMTLDWTPRLPDHLENPGGYFYGQCWADPAGTTPLDLQVRIYDALGIVVFETVIPEATYYYVGWVVPQGAMDGLYIYEATYRSVEGENASEQAGFLVAGAVTGLAAIKFYDLNGNGIYDGGEPFGAGWEMCPTGPVNLPCEFTDAFGVATWFNIPTGTYEICETPQGDYVCTTCGGDFCQTIDVLPNEIAKLTFGNWIPPVEACCFQDGHCEVLLPDECTNLGGIPQGPGSNCDNPELCPPPTGACCLPDGTCQVLSEEDCRANGGTDWTEGVDCDAVNCEPVATEANSWGRIKSNFR
jgi:hypothetical protein